MEYDVAIIGAGAAGIAAAKRALGHGLKALLIDHSLQHFGGTCLNQGCIPAKFFLKSAASGQTWPEIFSGASALIETIKKPLHDFLEKQGVTIVYGQARFVDAHTLSVAGSRIEARAIIIATGSLPRPIITHPKACFAQELFTRSSIGEKFLIIGAGSIGLEMASLLTRLGKTVQVVEKEARIAPLFDEALSNRLKVLMERRGIAFRLGIDVSQIDCDAFDTILLAAGRIPNTVDCSPGAAGIEVLPGGWIKTDDIGRTSIAGVYACGDVTGRRLLAYTAEYQAKLCVDHIAGKVVQPDDAGIPECVFSFPQIATVGVSAAAARKNNIEHRVVKSNFFKFSSAHVYHDTDGYMEIIIGPDDRLLGAAVISQAAGELISLFSMCVRNKLPVSALADMVLVHPTLSEIIPAILEAA